jgi:hypothetical protein
LKERQRRPRKAQLPLFLVNNRDGWAILGHVLT